MMRMVMVLLWLVLVCGQVLAEEATLDNRPFGALVFGEAPRADMLCTAGPCATGQQAVAHRSPDKPVAFYKRSSDLTHIAGVEISSPAYAYYQEQLFQVSFSILGPPDQGEMLVGALTNAFRAQQGLTLVFQRFNDDSPDEARQSWGYRLDNGWLLNVSRTLTDGAWQPPHVSLYEPERMDRLRLALNPDYRPHDD